jgi:hypothetical protein
MLEELHHLLAMVRAQVGRVEPQQEPVETGAHGSAAFALAARRSLSSLEASAASAVSPVRVIR